MAPWVGRIANAQFEWAGRTHRLQPNLGPHAIHGVVFDERWTIRERGDDSLTCTCDFDVQRWPPGGRVAQRVRLEPGTLTLEATVEAGAQAMPASVGWHPWWRREGDMRVRVDSDSVLATSEDLIPTGGTVAVQGDTDLRAGPALGQRRLDHVYTSVRGPAIVRWPELRLRIDLSQALQTVVVYTPPEGVCVEPQSAWPDAPALVGAGTRGTGLRSLRARESLDARAVIAWARP
jgi:aldose 1-epimerase